MNLRIENEQVRLKLARMKLKKKYDDHFRVNKADDKEREGQLRGKIGVTYLQTNTYFVYIELA